MKNIALIFCTLLFFLFSACSNDDEPQIDYDSFSGIVTFPSTGIVTSETFAFPKEFFEIFNATIEETSTSENIYTSGGMTYSITLKVSDNYAIFDMEFYGKQNIFQATTITTIATLTEGEYNNPDPNSSYSYVVKSDGIYLTDGKNERILTELDNFKYTYTMTDYSENGIVQVNGVTHIENTVDNKYEFILSDEEIPNKYKCTYLTDFKIRIEQIEPSYIDFGEFYKD